jgi:RNA polymerase-interacting CarD/CdnL/TRCF family regulator
MGEPAYRIDFDERDMVVRVPRSLAGREEVSRFLDYLDLESIRQRSQLTEEDAAALADEIDHAVWERLRHRLDER